MKKSSIWYLSLLASVAACSSGGGSNNAGVSAPVAAVTAQNIAPFTSGTAPANVAGFSYNCTAACPTSGVTGSDNVSKVSLATDAASGDQTMTLNITEGGASLQHKFDLGVAGANVVALANDPGSTGGWGGFFDVSDGPDANNNTYDVKFAGSADPTQSLTYMTFGLWAQGNTNGTAPGAYGVFASGNETPAAGIPTSGTATYSGTTIGAGSLNGTAANMTGTVAATADFGARTVDGAMNVNVFRDGVNSGFWNTLTFASGYASGSNHFAGTINAAAVTAGTAIAAGTPVITTSAMTGPLSGSFYGPGGTGGPQEIGGVFNMTNVSGTNNMLGAFGAHR